MKTKHIPVHGLEKLPDSILLSNALVENGKLQAYIQELEYEVEKLKKSIPSPDILNDKGLLRKLKKDKLYQKLRDENVGLKMRINELIEENLNLQSKP